MEDMCKCIHEHLCSCMSLGVFLDYYTRLHTDRSQRHVKPELYLLGKHKTTSLKFVLQNTITRRREMALLEDELSSYVI